MHFQGLEDIREKPHARERLHLVDAHRHLPRIDARLEQLGGDPEALRIRAGVPERARVGEDAGVDALGGVAADRVPQALDDLVGEDAHRGRVRIDIVHVAEGLGGDVVIEVEHLSAARSGRHVGAEAIDSARIGDHGDVVGSLLRQGPRHFGCATQELEIIG